MDNNKGSFMPGLQTPLMLLTPLSRASFVERIVQS